jgi:hypothetical protein
MRIKSYFAPSVQAAIALARKEFGDCVTLVTSHVTSLDNRHLGEYEVVFAIEEKADLPEERAEPPAPAFQDLLQQAIVTPPLMHQDVPDKLEQIHSLLVELGVESLLVRSFMAMLKVIVPEISNAPALLIPANLPVASIEAPAVSLVMPAPVLALEPATEEPPVAQMPLLSSPETDKPVPLPFDFSLFAASRPQPRFSAAELAFMSLVSSPKEQGA